MAVGRLEQWWRVEFNQAGNITSCETVETAERNTRVVFYIRAVCREHAIAEATRWLGRRQKKQRAYENRRRLARRKQGICMSCSKQVSKRSEICCDEHLKQKREYINTRNKAIKTGTWQPTQTPSDPVAAMANDTARRERYRRMGVQLNIVLAVFDQVDGRIGSPFRQWLVAEIAQRGGNLRAAE